MSGARRPIAAALAAALALLACDDLTLERWRGEHLIYTHEPALEVCAGTHAYMDAVVPAFADQLGLDAAAFPPLTYTWLRDETWAARMPDDLLEAVGVADADAAEARRPLVVHELAHLVVNQRTEGGLPFFVEGLPEALEEVRPEGGVRYPRRDPRPYLTAPLATLDRSVAAGFAAYLLARHGPEPYLLLLARTRPGTDEARLRAIFADLYGPLDAVVDDYLTGEACPEDALPIPLPPSCSAPERPWLAPDRWALARFVGCDDDDAAGGRSRGQNERLDPLLSAVTLLVEEPGEYTLRFDGPGAAVNLVRCGGCPWLRRDVALEGAGEAEIELAAGRHSLTIYADPEAHTQVVVTLERRAP